MITLKAREGYVWTNGELFSECVYLSDLETPDDWEEITEIEAMQRQESEGMNNDEIMA